MKGAVIALLMILAVARCAAADDANRGNVRGKLVDESGKPVTDAHILLNKKSYQAISDGNGRFALTDVKPGEYELIITRIGFEPVQQSIRIEEGEERELEIEMTPTSYTGKSVVVTATRSRRTFEDVPIPVSVVSQKEIGSSGTQRLSEILSEQIGMTLSSSHGTGIQLQGFDPEYTLIMIDGQPMIGRTAGTLDLSRISVGNIEQVEIVKGPSSALWGSDALAGVVNIITEKGSRPMEMDLSTRYGSNQTLDLNGNISFQTEKWSNTLFLNRNSSGGYRLNENSIAQTIPDYQNYTFNYRTQYELSDALELKLRTRYYTEDQQNSDFTGSSADPILLNNRGFLEDYNITPSVELRPLEGMNVELTHHYSRYRTDRSWTFQEDGSPFSRDQFDQNFQRSELQSNYVWNQTHITTAGGGLDRHTLNAERYAGNPEFTNTFFFGQHEWTPTQRLDLIAGFRTDIHSEYGSRVSPKFSASFDATPWLDIQASAGSGFKAPDFRQLFLAFTNPTAGYSVLGSSVAIDELNELEQAGQIDQININLGQMNEIRAEHSWAYNAGIELAPMQELRIQAGAFYNNVYNLIEAAPIAVKVNGESVFSYFNLDEIFTRGIEASASYTPFPQLNVALGYQFLDARRRVDETRTVQNAQGDIVEQRFVSFEPMFNRSRHSGTVKFFYELRELGLEANLRGELHGAYGRTDLNGNGFVDPGEFERGYSIWDLSLTKQFMDHYRIQVGVDNLFDFTRPADFAWLPGRLFYARASFQL